jgi:hypothetical protein
LALFCCRPDPDLIYWRQTFGPAESQHRREKMSEKQRIQNGERDRYIAIGLAIGMPSFALIGFALCIATDNPGLLGLGPAIGLALGIAIGEGLYQRSRQREGKER